VAVIDVADIEPLVRIAEHYDRSIPHERTDAGDAFWVADESGQFRFMLPGAGSEAQQPDGLPSAADRAEMALRDVAAHGALPPVPAAEWPHMAPEPASTDVDVEGDWTDRQLVSAIARESDGWGTAGEAADVTLRDC
jgi:hypothetical protein